MTGAAGDRERTPFTAGTMKTPSTDVKRAASRQSAMPGRVLFLVFVASGLLLSLAEFVAANGSMSLQFYIFWVGYFAVVLPVGWLLARRTTSDVDRGPLVLALAGWSVLPKMIRTGAQPLYFDEFSHLRLLEDLLRSGHPVAEPALLQIGSSFPGLEMITGGIVEVSGLYPWGAAMAVAAISHVAILAAIFILVSDITSSKRAGGLAALIYSLNPSWLFFDSQYAYETLAIPLLLWGLIFALRAIGGGTRAPKPSTTWTWVGLSFTFSLSLVVTHHVTAVVNCVLLTAMAVVVSLRRGRAPASGPESPQVAWLLAVWALIVTTTRFVAIGHPLAVYLSPALNLSGQFRQLLSLLGIASALQGHTAFGNTGLPLFEVVCGFLLPPVLLAAYVWAIWGLLARRQELGSFIYVAALTGLAYFASLPLLTAAQFGEAVHRSWAFSYIGLAVVIGLAADRALRGELSFAFRRRQVSWLRHFETRGGRVAVTVMFVVAAIGGVAAATTSAYRFGGPVQYGEDAAADGTQTSLVAAWFHDHGRSRQLVFADRYVAGPIAVSSEVTLVTPSAWWGITFDSQLSLQLAATFATIDYVVVDRRMGNGKPAPQGYWYSSSEPHGSSRYVIPPVNVLRFECLNWLNAVYATSDYEILAVDHKQLETDVGVASNGLSTACMARLERS